MISERVILMLSYEELKNGILNNDSRYQRNTSLQAESSFSNSQLNTLDIVLSTILIIVLCCGIPFLVAKFSKKHWSFKKRRIFIVCNAIISYLIIAAIKIILDPANAAPPNIAAVAIWSFVASSVFQHYHPESKK